MWLGFTENTQNYVLDEEKLQFAAYGEYFFLVLLSKQLSRIFLHKYDQYHQLFFGDAFFFFVTNASSLRKIGFPILPRPTKRTIEQC